jgi:hypothetical protein
VVCRDLTASQLGGIVSSNSKLQSKITKDHLWVQGTLRNVAEILRCVYKVSLLGKHHADVDNRSMDKEWLKDDINLAGLLAMCVDKLPEGKTSESVPGGSRTSAPASSGESSTKLVDLSSLSVEELEAAYKQGNLRAGKILFDKRDGPEPTSFTKPVDLDTWDSSTIRDWYRGKHNKGFQFDLGMYTMSTLP